MKSEKNEINFEKEEAKVEVEEQYRILKDEEEKEEKKKLFILIVIFLLIFSISFTGAGFSYLRYRTTINSNPNNVVEQGGNGNGGSYKPNGQGGSSTTPEDITLSILFTEGAEFVAEEIEPGWESTAAKGFAVTNTGNGEAEYNIEFNNITSDFVNLQDLRYTIKRNNETIKEDQPVPSDTTTILSGEKIEVGKTNEYEIYYKYIDTKKPQNVDKGKTYKMHVDVKVEQ